jgi:hypothetical protein
MRRQARATDAPPQFDPRYKNDQRFLNVWIQMADKRGDPREVFDFMHEHDICTGLPKYYVAVASVAEKRGDLAAAEAAYLAGVRVADGRWRDQPKGSAQHDAAGKELAWASKQLNHFQRRLARKLINASAQTTRALHGVSPPSVQQAAARQSPRPIATGRPPMPTAAPSSLQARPFNVFQGPPASGAKPPAAAAKHPQWTPLQAAVGAENAPVPQPWAGSALSGAGGARSGGAHAAPTFRVWEQDAMPDLTAAATANDPFNLWDKRPPSAEPSLSHRFGDLRADLGADVPSAGRGLCQPPPAPALPHPASQPPSRAKVPATAARGLPPASALAGPTGHGVEQDMTINTRMALEDMFDVFASPSMSTAKPVAPSRAAPRPGQFEPSRLVFTPAPPPALAAAAQEDGGERENCSPNAPPTAAAASTARRPLHSVKQRAVLTTIECHDQHMSPSFRALMSSRRPSPKESFSVFADDAPKDSFSVFADDAPRGFFSARPEATFQGGSLGLTETFHEDGKREGTSSAKPSFGLFED